jgi:hypothetical protein
MPANDQQLVSQLADAIHKAAQGQPSWTSYIPGVSAVISTLSAFLSILFFVRSQKNTRAMASEARGYKLLPVIVFYRRSERVWILKNVGEGTAINVVIRNYLAINQVRDEVTLYPVTPGEEIQLDYLNGPAVRLIAKYVNIFGQDPHYTVCSRNVNEIKAGLFEDSVATPFGEGHESRIDEWPVTRLATR